MNRNLLCLIGLALLFASLGPAPSPNSASARSLQSVQANGISASQEFITSKIVIAETNPEFKTISLAATGQDRANSVVFSPGDQSIVVGASFGIYLLDAQTLEKRAFIPTQTLVRSLAISPDGRLIASGQYENDIHLWRTSDEGLDHTLTGHQGWVRSLAFSPDGRILASISDDDTLRLWNTADGTSLRVIRDGLKGVRTLAVSPVGNLLATGMMNGEIRLWRIEDGNLVHILHGHTDWVRALAFSPDGSLLASGSFDKTVRIWRVGDGTLLHTLQGHSASVLSVAFSPDGHKIASGSVDQTIRIWQVPEGKPLHVLTGPENFVFSVAYSHNGDKLAVGSADNAVRVWEVATFQNLPPLSDKAEATPAPAQSCTACHHPRKEFEPARVIEMSCNTCHDQGALVMNWCPIFPRADVPIKVSVTLPDNPDLVGVPHGSPDLSVQIFSPGNGEHYYAQGDILAVAQVTGKVFFTDGSPKDVSIRLLSESNDNQIVLYDTHPQADGSYALTLSLSPQGSEPWMLAGLPSSRFSQCYLCHDQDLAGAPTLPDGLVHLRVEATAPDGQTAYDERWIWRDTSQTETITIDTTLTRENHEPIQGLAVQADSILYDWRPRTFSTLTDASGVAHMQIETQPNTPTKYTFQVEPQILNGVQYQSVDSAHVTIAPSEAAPTVSLPVESHTGSIQGIWKIPAEGSPSPIPVWAIRLPDGMAVEATTDLQGSFTFNDLPLAPYKLVGDPQWLADHHLSVDTKNLDIRQERTAQVSDQFATIPAGKLNGRILGEGGAWLPFAWVSVQPQGMEKPTLPESGQYLISGLGKGKFTTIAMAPGYYSQAQAVNLSTDAYTQDFTLAPQPGLHEVPWGDGKIIIPPDTNAEINGLTINFIRGWLWGQAISGEPLTIQARNETLVISSGKFALQSYSTDTAWLYLWQGSAQISKVGEEKAVTIHSGQMIALGTNPPSYPVGFTPAAFFTLSGEQPVPIDITWQPTLKAQIRDRLAWLGISLAQLMTLIVYSLVVLIAILFPIAAIIWFIRRRTRPSI